MEKEMRWLDTVYALAKEDAWCQECRKTGRSRRAGIYPTKESAGTMGAGCAGSLSQRLRRIAFQLGAHCLRSGTKMVREGQAPPLCIWIMLPRA